MQRPEWIRAAALIVVAALLLLLPGMASLGLWAPDEPRAAAVTREMFEAEHGPASLVLLRLNGEPYTQKPPLYYWMASAFSLLPGEVTEWTARAPSVLGGLATLLLTLAFGRRLLGARTALLGAALLLTTYDFVHLARRVQFDVLLTFFELGALAALWRLDRGIGDAGRNRLLAHGAMGLAMLVKGPVGILLPLLTWAAYLYSERRLRDLRQAISPLPLLLSAGPILAWLAAAAALAPPGFFGETVGGGVVSRFFQGTSHARPFYYFLYQFPIEFLPWTLLLPAVFVVARRSIFAPGADPDRRRAWRLALANVGVTFVFFSLSAGKRGLYVLPCFPLLALLCADALRELLAHRSRAPRALAWGFAAAGALLAGIGAFALRAGEVAGAAIPPLVPIALVVLPVLGTIAWQYFARQARTPALAFVLVATAWGLLATIFWGLYPALDPIRSMKPVADAARRWAPAHEAIALVGSRPMIGGLAYYAMRPVDWIDEVEDVPAYFARGGTTLIAKEKKLERIRSVAPVVVRERVREGDRALVVVQHAPPGPASTR